MNLEYRSVAEDRTEGRQRQDRAAHRTARPVAAVTSLLVLSLIVAGGWLLYWRGYEAGFNAANVAQAGNVESLLKQIEATEHLADTARVD